MGLELPGLAERRREVAEGAGRLEPSDGPEVVGEAVGELLFAVADMARRLGVDPESALRRRAGRFREEVESREAGTPAG